MYELTFFLFWGLQASSSPCFTPSSSPCSSSPSSTSSAPYSSSRQRPTRNPMSAAFLGPGPLPPQGPPPRLGHHEPLPPHMGPLPPCRGLLALPPRRHGLPRPLPITVLALCLHLWRCLLLWWGGECTGECDLERTEPGVPVRLLAEALSWPGLLSIGYGIVSVDSASDIL